LRGCSHRDLRKFPPAGCSPLGQLAAFIQERIRHVYRRQRTTPLPSRTPKGYYRSQLGVDGLDVAHARSLRSARQRGHFIRLGLGVCAPTIASDVQKLEGVAVLDPTKGVVKAVSSGVVAFGALLAVTGFLAARQWATPTTTWTAMGSIATVAAAAVAIWTLVALRQDSRDRTRPVMIAEIRPAVLSDVAELHIRNAGPSVAKNVSFEFDPELPALEGPEAAGMTTPYLQRRYSRTIPIFGPGMTMHDDYQSANDPDEPVPEEFTLTINYFDMHGREYNDSYELSVEWLRDHIYSRPGDTHDEAIRRRIAEAVEAVARGVGRR
jgi:hypothetical protein